MRVPIQKGIIGSLTAVRFSRNLGLLIKSGINISVALEMIKPVMNNRYIVEKIDEVILAINEGKPFAESLEKLNLFPWVLMKLFAIAQDTGHMDKVLFRAADVMEKELDQKLNKLTTVIEPALIMILSIIVGVILISVILPIVDIMNAIG
jgi:type IV pilus assembly protein PilC